MQANQKPQNKKVKANSPMQLEVPQYQNIPTKPQVDMFGQQNQMDPNFINPQSQFGDANGNIFNMPNQMLPPMLFTPPQQMYFDQIPYFFPFFGCNHSPFY